MDIEEGEQGFGYGDRVRFVQNADIKGQVVNERGWGLEFEIRLSGTLANAWVSACEIELDPLHMPPLGSKKTDDEDSGAEEHTAGAKVINLASVRAEGRA
jgi:hypothetical protein